MFFLILDNVLIVYKMSYVCHDSGFSRSQTAFQGYIFVVPVLDGASLHVLHLHFLHSMGRRTDEN